jgi:uncharacterized protein (DUF983 family)
MPISPEAGYETVRVAEVPERQLQPSLRRGAAGRCPSCGVGRIFTSYLKVAPSCSHCSEPLHHQRADDAPAYFTMVVVGHVIVGGILAVEKAFAPPTWVQLAVWLPLMVLLSLVLLPVIKGALVALQWALRMHGFGQGGDPATPQPDPAYELTLLDRGKSA